MLADVAILIIVIILDILRYIGGLVQLALPPWISTGINSIFSGAGWLNSILPVYPHPGYSGLAGQIGIMSIFGWVVVLAGFFVIIAIVYWVIRLVISLLPWNTHSVKAPHALDK